MKKQIFTGEILIANIRYIYPQLPTGGELRIAIGALTLTNQKSNVNDDCIPMIAGWNENPAVGFSDFQWWTKSRIEESHFIIGKTIIPFSETLSLSPEVMHGEPSVILKFKNGLAFRITVRDESKPIEVCVRDGKPNFIKNKIEEYGYTDLSGD